MNATCRPLPTSPAAAPKRAAAGLRAGFARAVAAALDAAFERLGRWADAHPPQRRAHRLTPTA